MRRVSARQAVFSGCCYALCELRNWHVLRGQGVYPMQRLLHRQVRRGDPHQLVHRLSGWALPGSSGAVSMCELLFRQLHQRHHHQVPVRAVPSRGDAASLWADWLCQVCLRILQSKPRQRYVSSLRGRNVHECRYNSICLCFLRCGALSERLWCDRVSAMRCRLFAEYHWGGTVQPVFAWTLV